MREISTRNDHITTLEGGLRTRAITKRHSSSYEQTEEDADYNRWKKYVNAIQISPNFGEDISWNLKTGHKGLALEEYRILRANLCFF